jgi:hypothetical protein
MPWFDEPASTTQLERVKQILLAKQTGLITPDILINNLDEVQLDRFIFLVNNIDITLATKGTAGELIGLVKKALADSYESKIKSIEVK